MVTISPYGTWDSPISPAALTESAVGLSQIQVWDGQVWWVESRPSEAGRQVLMGAPLSRSAGPWTATERLPASSSVRTQVHEYGGRCVAGRAGAVLWSSWDDQRLWLLKGTGPARPLTPVPDRPRALRYADPVISPDGRWAVCVRERHLAHDVVNEVVAVRLAERDAGREPLVLASGRDFYAAPRLSPAGDRLAWLEWDHPNMPWDHTELMDAPFAAGALGTAHRVAGAAGESVTQPRWSPDGTLHFISDRTGWYNLYAEGDRALAPLDAEFAGPDWVFGESTYAFLPDGRLFATWSGRGPAQLGLVGTTELQPFELPFSSYSSLAAGDGELLLIAASPTQPPALARVDVDAGALEIVRASRPLPVDPAWLSSPSPVTFPSGGESAHAWYYPPTNPEFAAPPGELPPLIVVSHGGPTSATSPVFNLALQYWTSRGFAIADVDYRGSSGYGRAYRDRLRGQWGVLDVEDCSSVVGYLAERGLADPARAVIRGGSAGGFTTLAALTFTNTFAAGASLYGVADLELLARDTHKFESRYLDGLVGRWPEEAAIYQERSPLHHLRQLRCPVILFQGEDDAVVPRSQADAIYAALREQGVTVEYLLFPGEQHGFRQAATIQAVATAELAFYGRVLGFRPAGGPDPDSP